MDKCPQELNPIPRSPARAIYNEESRKIIESDLFRLLIIDGFSWLSWPFMGVNGAKEIYSGYDPAWKLSHSPDIWIHELVKKNQIPSSVECLKTFGDDDVGYMSWEEVSAIMSEIVPAAMKRHNLYEVIKVANEFRCFEDFDTRYSSRKVDFHRKWYHSRTKIGTMLSLDTLMEDDEDGIYEVEDESAEFEDKVIGEDYYQRFKEQLSEKDMKILELRVQGLSYEEIAKKLGYKNHSGVIKRMKSITKEFLKHEE